MTKEGWRSSRLMPLPLKTSSSLAEPSLPEKGRKRGREGGREGRRERGREGGREKKKDEFNALP